jgi:hypothetical protein
VLVVGEKGDGGVRGIVFEKDRKMYRKKPGTFPEKIPVRSGKKFPIEFSLEKFFAKVRWRKFPKKKIPEIPSAPQKNSKDPHDHGVKIFHRFSSCHAGVSFPGPCTRRRSPDPGDRPSFQNPDHTMQKTLRSKELAPVSAVSGTGVKTLNFGTLKSPFSANSAGFRDPSKSGSKTKRPK